MLIRAALPDEGAAVRAVITAAFYRPDEADLVQRLRDDGEALFELVADDGGLIVGHILFSLLQAGPERAFAALAPLSVAPDRHRQGIGGRLCEAALRQARRDNLEAVLVLGDPLYYGRFGFSHAAAAQIASPYSGNEAFQALALQSGALDEPVSVTYPAAFG
jgi:putative acetyltransferase